MNDRFNRELLRWAGESGDLSAEQARTLVLERLPRVADQRAGRRFWAAAVVSAALVVGLVAGARAPVTSTQATAREATPTAPAGFVVLRLSSGTLVFVALPAPRARGAS